MTSKMKSDEPVWHKQHDIRVESFPDPGPPAPDAVRVQVTWCGICGTDLEEYLYGPLFHSCGETKPPDRSHGSHGAGA